MSIGEKIDPILNEINDVLWEFDTYVEEKPNYPLSSLNYATKIFSSVIMDKIMDLKLKENIPFIDVCNMAENAGKDIRKLIKIYTDIDTYDFFKSDSGST